MADGKHDLSDILVRVNGVEKLLLFLRGYPEISLTNGGNKSVIYDGTSPLFTLYIKSVTYITVTRNSNKIPILTSNYTVVYLTQVNEGNSIPFIYTIGFSRCFGIHSVISLLFP